LMHLIRNDFVVLKIWPRLQFCGPATGSYYKNNFVDQLLKCML
jgi:hypothetical protein